MAVFLITKKLGTFLGSAPREGPQRVCRLAIQMGESRGG